MRIPIASALALAAIALLAQGAAAQPSKKNVPPLEKKVLSLEAARKMVATAEAERNHWRGVVAVVDEGGWLIMLERMDHAGMTPQETNFHRGSARDISETRRNVIVVPHDDSDELEASLSRTLKPYEEKSDVFCASSDNDHGQPYVEHTDRARGFGCFGGLPPPG
jgi:heme-degrading protein